MSDQYPPPPGQQPGNYGDAKAQAKAAAAYAKSQRPWFKKKRFIIPIAIVVVVMIAQASSGGSSDDDKKAEDKSSSTSNEAPKGDDAKADEKKSDDSKSDDKEPEKKPEPEKPKKAFDVKTQAGAMIKEFEENELGADAKYKDKVVQVTGIVSKIDTEMFDDQDYVLKINGGSDFEFLTVDCFDISNDDLAKLKVGDKVTMIGDFKDGGDLGVELNHCKLK